MNAVIYARYSSDNQREESIEGQVRECREYAEKNGMDIIGVYTDRAFSAKTDNRPEFQQLIKDSANKSFEVVLVWKLDRFARNRYDSAKYKYVLKKNGVRVISATETISEGAEGILLETMLEGMAEYYSVELAEKVKRGQTENALKCKYNGGGIPFGLYVDGEQHLKPDPVTAPLVKEIFVNYSEGMKLQQIVDNGCIIEESVNISPDAMVFLQDGLAGIADTLMNLVTLTRLSFELEGDLTGSLLWSHCGMNGQKSKTRQAGYRALDAIRVFYRLT